MGTKGDISDLDVLMFGCKPKVPLVSGFNRSRRSGVALSDVAGGASRQRKRYFGTVHDATANFYLRSAAEQDFIQSFINRNEGKKFICYLAADRPIVEPYVVQAIGDWSHVEVNKVEGTVSIQLEIFSTKEPCLDEFLYVFYSGAGDDLYDILNGFEEIIEAMPDE